MSGPHRNPDKLNSIGIVVVGICGAVLVYVSIVALQAFYMNDSSEVQTMADYGGQDTAHKSLRTQQVDNLKKYAPHPAPAAPGEGQAAPPQRYTISIDDAIPLVVQSAKKDPSNLVPANGPAVTPSVQPIFGRPQAMPQPAPGGAAAPAAPADATGAGTGSAAAPAGAAGAGSSAPMTPTGGQGPGGGPPPGTQGQPKLESPPIPPRTPAAQPKAGTTAPAQPKAGTTPAQPKAGTTPAQPKAGTTPAQPKGTAPKQPAPSPGQPKKGNAS